MTYEELVKNHAGSLVEKLVTEVINKDYIEVHFEEADKEEWAVIKMHIYEEDKEIAVCLLSNDQWFLHFGYYDDDDEFFELVQPHQPTGRGATACATAAQMRRCRVTLCARSVGSSTTRKPARGSSASSAAWNAAQPPARTNVPP